VLGVALEDLARRIEALATEDACHRRVGRHMGKWPERQHGPWPLRHYPVWNV